MIPEDSDSWPTTGPVMRYDVFKGEIPAAELPMILPSAGISIRISRIIRIITLPGTESLLLQSKRTSAIEYRDLDANQNACGIFWPKVDQFSRYQATCLWRRCFCCSWKERSNDHWMSLVFKFRRVILEDLLTGKPSD